VKKRTEIALAMGLVLPVLAVAAGVALLVETVTPEQHEGLFGPGFMVLPAAAVAAAFALRVLWVRRCVLRGRGASTRAVTAAMLACVGVVAIHVFTGASIMAVLLFCPVETRGFAVFHPHRGHPDRGVETVRLAFPAGWRVRYGRQSWREGTVLGDDGRPLVRLVLSVDPLPPPAAETPLRAYVARRERDPEWAPQPAQETAPRQFRTGPRGEQWIRTRQRMTPRGRVPLLDVTELAGPEILTFHLAGPSPGVDVDLLALAGPVLANVTIQVDAGP
jgi:hypothetical protein